MVDPLLLSSVLFYHGLRPILPGHIPVVYHLEYCLLHRSFLHAWSLNLDTLEGHLRLIAETHYPKILATADLEVRYKPKVCFVRHPHTPSNSFFQVFVSQIWNAIITSMYREHLLSIDHVQKLLYYQVDTPDSRRSLRAPLPILCRTDRQGFQG